MLGGPGDVILWSLTKAEDERYRADLFFENVLKTEQINRKSLAYLESLFRRIILKEQDAGMNLFLRDTFKNNIAIAVGGDNYCYPWSADQAGKWNDQIRKYCKKSVLWACSIDEESLTDSVKTDLSQYDLITAREQLTYQLLKSVNKNVKKVADPAFLLPRTDRPLPERFLEGNTVGINISPMVMDYSQDENLLLRNYEKLIEYILRSTDLNICFIPHVVWDYNNDLRPIGHLYNKYQYTERICMVHDGNAEELKGDIARCRFFVGARTHATIAAYSSFVPTLVMGYSVKSKGIARDLFGKDENYVLSSSSLSNELELTEGFQWLMKNEREIRCHLKDIIPEYSGQAEAAGYIDDLL